MKTVGLFDCDNKKPNLAVMKLSAWYKQQGFQTFFNPSSLCDLNFASCVFPQNAAFAYHLRDKIGAVIGGSGVDVSIRLDDEIEHTCPDYDLYGMDYSLGFTSRGCIRSCKFCIVPEKEGGIVEHSAISEFVRHKKVVLQDNNFLASPLWKEKLIEMAERCLRVDFNQGLDVRLLTEESAELLTKLNPPVLRFAWDDMRLENAVMHGIDLLRKAGFPVNRRRLMFYVLTNFNTTFEEDLYRVERLHSHDVTAFVQIYGKGSKKLKTFQRWANMPGCWQSFSLETWLKINSIKDGGEDRYDQPMITDFLAVQL